LDHAGGLEYFRGTDVPVYVHEIELKNAFYSVASKVDIGMYTIEHPSHQTNQFSQEFTYQPISNST